MSNEQRSDTAADIAALVAEARAFYGSDAFDYDDAEDFIARLADALEAVARERDRDAAMGTQTTVLSIFTGEFVRQAMEVPEYERETDSPNHVVRELYAALLTAEKERDAALARAEAAEAELARLGPVERVWLTNETRWQKIRRVLDPLLREGGAE
jgi:hypothetical protein